MGTLQEDLNSIGAAVRDLEAAAGAAGSATISAKAAALHTKLAQGFARHIRPDHPELDWNAIAGNTAPKPGQAQTQSGGKHEPTVEN